MVEISACIGANTGGWVAVLPDPTSCGAKCYVWEMCNNRNEIFGGDDAIRLGSVVRKP
jgi:hypothetical protein